jgi:hypothetical protein
MDGTPAEGLLLLLDLVGAAERRPGAARTATKAIVYHVKELTEPKVE